jgi:mannose-6-phosphate isomerase class I
MTDLTRGPWRVEDELIEQPSWGGRMIIDLKGLSTDPAWTGKKVGQSYELAGSSVLIDPATGESRPMRALIAEDPEAFLGKPAVARFGPELSLLIKLTQAKGNSFQVHLPEGKTLGHWKPKPEAWFYLAPGLYTFGLKAGTSHEAFAQVLRSIDDEMQRLSHEVKESIRTVADAREQAHHRIQALDPYAYVNVVEAATDDVIDLTAGGIHHSWEEDNARFPEGNIVYEVQVDVPDELCSMRGFDKGKILDDGSLRPTHVEDYLKTVENDAEHNDLARHIAKPRLLSDEAGVKVEALFRTPYFSLDRLTLSEGAATNQSLAQGFHHLFIHGGAARIGAATLDQGRSYMLPAAAGAYDLQSDSGAVILKTYLPTG